MAALASPFFYLVFGWFYYPMLMFRDSEDLTEAGERGVWTFLGTLLLSCFFVMSFMPDDHDGYGPGLFHWLAVVTHGGAILGMKNSVAFVITFLAAPVFLGLGWSIGWAMFHNFRDETVPKQ